MGLILSDVSLDAAVLRSLIPDVSIHHLEPHAADWDLNEASLAGIEILLCKRPPRNFARLRDLGLMQLSTVA